MASAKRPRRRSPAKSIREAKGRAAPSPRPAPRAARAPSPPAARGPVTPSGASRERAAPEAPASALGSRGKYVYCIIPGSESSRFGAIGMGARPAEVTTVNYRSIAAVVSDTPVEALDATRDNVLAHERVNETVMRRFTVIPMSFGTLFKTREDIVELLRGAYDAFQDVLVKMKDKLEFGLKVLWDRDLEMREVEDEDEDMRRLKNELSSVKGPTYFARMQYGRLMDAALQARSERYVSDIFAQLGDVSVASRANKPIGDRMIMNAAFLVSRDKEVAFDSKVREVGAVYDRLSFKYTGPWPPYNFVNIRLKLERAREPE